MLSWQYTAFMNTYPCRKFGGHDARCVRVKGDGFQKPAVLDCRHNLGMNGSLIMKMNAQQRFLINNMFNTQTRLTHKL